MPNSLNEIVIEILAFVMVPIAIGIASVRDNWSMIRLYRVQSMVLALFTVLIAIDYLTSSPGKSGLTTFSFLIAFTIVIPLMLFYIIEPLLAAATLLKDISIPDRLLSPLLRAFSKRHRDNTQQWVKEAKPVWLEHGLSLRAQLLSLSVSLLLIAIAYIVAFNFGVNGGLNRPPSLVVSIALLMLGIFTMFNRRDLISQVIGLLVMDHGLFVAVVRGVFNVALIPFFIVSLFFYILITLVILVILLPALHRKSESIEVKQQNKLEG